MGPLFNFFFFLKKTFSGVEYIVSDQIFETLSPDEQKLWHSHAYEVFLPLFNNV